MGDEIFWSVKINENLLKKHLQYIIYYVKIYITKKESEDLKMKAFYMTLVTFADSEYKCFALLETIANNAQLSEDDYIAIFRATIEKLSELRRVPQELRK